MWQAEIEVDLDAIKANLARLREATTAEIMAVVKANGYGHGMLPVARAALAGGATWLGVCTLTEALAVRQAGLTAPVLAWLFSPGLPLHEGVEADVDLSASSVGLLAEIVAAGRRAGRTPRVHLKIDSGLSRAGATAADWSRLCEAAAKAVADGEAEIVAIWSHFANSDLVGHHSIDGQLAEFREALDVAAGFGIDPPYRHMANSAATLTRRDAHFDLVRAGIAMYGLSPIPGETFGLRPAMTVRARVALAKRVAPGRGVSYGHTYFTKEETTLAVVPLGYGDGIPRSASNTAPIRLAGANRTIAGRVCMDQVVVDCGDDPVKDGDVAVLFGPGDSGEPTAHEWAAATGTITYEIVTRIGSQRVPRVYVRGDGEAGHG